MAECPMCEDAKRRMPGRAGWPWTCPKCGETLDVDGTVMPSRAQVARLTCERDEARARATVLEALLAADATTARAQTEAVRRTRARAEKAEAELPLMRLALLEANRGRHAVAANRAELVRDVDALTRERDEAVASAERVEARLKFLESEHHDDEHPPRFWETVDDGDHCVACERDALRAALNNLVGFCEQLGAVDAIRERFRPFKNGAPPKLLESALADARAALAASKGGGK